MLNVIVYVVGGTTGVSKFAVTVTGFAGIVNVVVRLAASLNVTLPLVTVQCVNCCPAGTVAVTVTVALAV
jgi:hypothetical protein